jgi:hypothetical protein
MRFFERLVHSGSGQTVSGSSGARISDHTAVSGIAGASFVVCRVERSENCGETRAARCAGISNASSAAVNGTESDLLRTFLASPQLGCIALAGPITALLPPVATACQQFATAIQPYSSLLGGALTTIK